MTAYWVGDQPLEPLLVVPARDGKPIDLAPYTGASAALTTPAGTTTLADAAIVDDEDEGRVVAITLPRLDDAGLWLLRVTITAGAASATFEVAPVVVQALDGWHSLASAHSEWPDSAALEDHRLFVLLETSKAECVAYAGPRSDLSRLPLSFREAQLLHARNRNAAGRIDPASGDAGGDGFTLSAFPLDWTVRQLLRPQRGSKRVR